MKNGAANISSNQQQVQVSGGGMKKGDVPKAEADIKDLKSSRLSAITAMRQFRFADDLKS